MPDPKDTTFRPVGASDQRMHGSPAVCVAGLSAEQQTRLRALMNENGLDQVRAIYITPESLELTLDAAARSAPESGFGTEAKLPQAIIMSGLQEQQLHALMDAYRVSGLPRPMWATVTPTSEAWTIKYLLVELLKEREALRQARTKEMESDGGT